MECQCYLEEIILIWHCENDRLDFAVGHAVEKYCATGVCSETWSKADVCEVCATALSVQD
jgi:hypothetical protein